MRTLSWISRVFAAGAAVAALALIVGGSYYVGFVGEVQRGLNDPQSASRQAADKISSVEQILGYQGYLRSYRSFRLTGDITARQQLTQRAMEASRALDGLKSLFAGSPDAKLAINDIEAVVEEFARVARSAPETATAALRGSASMDALDAMPQVPQMESTYLTLRSGLDRLRAQARSYQMGSVAWALSWSQMLIICAFATVVCGLVAAASLLQIGITQPLKLLARSLQVAGEGRLGHPIWGTDRTDEIGEMARAGEKLRKSLTETDALQELAQKAQLNIRIEGEASALLGRTMSVVVTDVQQATDALRLAAEELKETQAAQRQSLEAQAASISGIGAKLEDVASVYSTTARQVFDNAATELHAATSSIMKVAQTRDAQFAAIATQLENRGSQASEAFDFVRTRTSNAVDSLTNSIAAFSKGAESTQTIQAALFASCDRISSDASTTAEDIRALAGRLEAVIASVETQAQQRAAPAGGQQDETDGFEEVLRVFKSDQQAENTALSASMCDMLVERMTTVFREQLTPDASLRQQVEAMRNDIRELALRMTEERILMTAEMPAPALAAEVQIVTASPQRTMSDMPSHEILERLRRLSDEMTAPPSATADVTDRSNDTHEQDEAAPSLTDNLKAFAMSVKPLGDATDQAGELRDMAPHFARYAEAIELSAQEVAHAAALRAELDAITTELRTLAATLQASSDAKSGDLQETALDLGARAETLFTYLNQRRATGRNDLGAEVQAQATSLDSDTGTFTRATQDLLTLARIITSLEHRTAMLSDAAVAANISSQTQDGAAPGADDVGTPPAHETETAIAVVYDAVERLNNIAAALARAADASRLREAATA